MATKYDPYIDRIAELVSNSGVVLQEFDRQIIASLWGAWEEKRPISFVLQDDRVPIFSFVEESYSPHKTYSDSYTVHPPSSDLSIQRYCISAEGNILSSSEKISFSEQQSNLESVGSMPSEPDEGVDFDVMAGEYKLKKNVGSLAAAIDAVLLPKLGHSFNGKILDVVAEYEKTRFNPIVDEFLRHLDKDVATALEITGLRNGQAINWFGGDGDAHISKYRLQAVHAYPVFAQIFTGQYEFPRQRYWGADTISDVYDLEGKSLDRHNQEIEVLRNHVDNGQAIAPILQNDLLPFAISKRVLRSLGKIKSCPQDIDFDSFLRSIPHLENMDTNWHPKNTEELSDYLHCFERAKVLKSSMGRSVSDILQETKGKWLEWKDKTISDAEAKDVSDWVEEIKKTCIRPLLYRKFIEEEKSRYNSTNAMKSIFARATFRLPSLSKIEKKISEQENTVFEQLMANVSTAEMIVCSKLWHSELADYQIQSEALGISDYDNLSTWTPLTKPLQAPNGIWLHPRTSKTELKRESNVLGHCVGNGTYYSSQCMAGDKHIIGLTSDEEGRACLTTVELKEQKKKNSVPKNLSIEQHQGYERRAPSERETQAINWYVGQIFAANDNDAQVDWAAIEQAREVAKKKKDEDGVLGKVGFDPQINDLCKATYDFIRPYLPKRFSSKRYEVFINDLEAGAQEHLQKINPSTSHTKNIVLTQFG